MLISVEIVVMLEANSDFVDEISRDVSLLRSLISVLSVEKVSAERSDMSAVVDEVKSLISRDNSLDVYDDKSLISLDVRDWTALISCDVSLLRSEISVLSVEKVSAEISEISAVVDEVKSLISRDNSLDV